VEVCVLASSATPQRNVALFRSDPGVPATELPEVAASLINCTGFGPFPTIGLSPHRNADLARATWHRIGTALGRLLGPEPLLARSAMGHLGDGGLSCCFSNFGWALPLQMTGPVSVTGLPVSLTGPAGGAVTVNVLVRYTHGFETPSAAAGVSVSFTPTQGTVSASTVTTNASGIATTSWTLVAGANVLVATAKATGTPLSITATGTTIP
jgi:hypothetical protein